MDFRKGRAIEMIYELNWTNSIFNLEIEDTSFVH